ncbi:MAG: hypothetical protein IKI15_09745 [Lachnospiraceae bacterium]|jgi:hypothetical protein|nr:hypothetical protein [Lachnospiraceae bacterium]MBR7021323.1 hypothetical protein [Lachnospiraceae bacterium]
MIYNDEPIIIKDVHVPRREYTGELGVPLTIAGLAGIVVSVFLPYVTTRLSTDAATRHTFTSWEVSEVSNIGFLTKYFFLVFSLLAVAAVWKQSSKLLVACCMYWILNFFYCVTNAHASEALFAGSQPAITENTGVFEYSMGIGFYVYILAVVLFVVGTVLFCMEQARNE